MKVPFGFFKSVVVGGASAIVANYKSRIIANGGSISSTEESSVLGLVTNAIANGWWDKMIYIYPMLGGNAQSFAINLVNNSYIGSFTSGFTYSSTGLKGSGTNCVMYTGFNPFVYGLNPNSQSYSFYSRTNNTFNGSDLGGQNGFVVTDRVAMAIYFSGTAYFDVNNFTDGRLAVTSPNTLGMYNMTRTANNIFKVFKNSSQFGTTLTNTNSSNVPNAQISICGLHFNDGIRSKWSFLNF